MFAHKKNQMKTPKYVHFGSTLLYVENQEHQDDDNELEKIYKDRPLPIYLDESCRFSENIPKFANHVDGVNMKLMKCGGITEALKIISTAKAHGLKT